VADAGGVLRGERSRSAALPGGLGREREDGGEKFTGRRGLREYKVERFGKFAVNVRGIFGETALLLAMMLTASVFFSVR
jgi:hypothetical protein